MIKLALKLLLLLALISGFLYSLKTQHGGWDYDKGRHVHGGILLKHGWQEDKSYMKRAPYICTSLQMSSYRGFPFVEFSSPGGCGKYDKVNPRARLLNILFKILILLGTATLAWNVIHHFKRERKSK